MTDAMKEYTIFATETITREIEYIVWGRNEEDARENLEKADIIDSWTVDEMIDGVVIHRVTEVIDDDL